MIPFIGNDGAPGIASIKITFSSKYRQRLLQNYFKVFLLQRTRPRYFRWITLFFLVGTISGAAFYSCESKI